MGDNEGLGAWGSLIAGLGAVIGVPWIYLVENPGANFPWYLHGLFAVGFLWGIYSALKGAVWLYGRWMGRDDGLSELKAGEWGCWGLALLIAAASVLFNWEAASARLASLDNGTGLILFGLFGLGYFQYIIAKALDRHFEELSRRLDSIESTLAKTPKR